MKKYTLKTTLLFIAIQIVIFIGAYILYTNLENNPLLVFMITLFVLEIALIGLLYYLLNKKHNDIEMSKRKFLGAKPFLIEVDRFGKIKSYNDTCRRNLRNIGKFKSIHDFTLADIPNIIEELYLQKPFIAGIDDEKKKKKDSFSTFKNFRRLSLGRRRCHG